MAGPLGGSADRLAGFHAKLRSLAAALEGFDRTIALTAELESTVPDLYTQADSFSRERQAQVEELARVPSLPTLPQAGPVPSGVAAGVRRAVDAIAAAAADEASGQQNDHLVYLEAVAEQVRGILARSDRAAAVGSSASQDGPVKRARRLELHLHREVVAALDSACEESEQFGQELDAVPPDAVGLRRIYPLSGDPVDALRHTIRAEDDPGGEHGLTPGSVLVCDEPGYEVRLPDDQEPFILRKATVIVVAGRAT